MLVSILVLAIIAIEGNQIQFKARGVPAAEAAADARGQMSDVRGRKRPEEGRGSKLQIPTAKLQ
jgi:hypothetical protein